MFLDDLENDGLEIPLPEGVDISTGKAWVNAVFWAWYRIHSHEEIISFSVFGLKLRRWKWSDLHGAFIHIFGAEPTAEAV